MKTPSAVLLFAAVVVASGDAQALHTSLAQFLARVPVEANASLTLDQVEACVKTAHALDRTGNELDMQMEAIQTASGQAMFLHYLNRAQLPRLDDAGADARAEYDQRVGQHDALRRKLGADIPIYEKRMADYETGVKAFDRDCAGTFTARDRDAAKAKLGIQ
jgi:hypothetical protein